MNHKASWIHRDVLIALVEALCAVLLISLPQSHAVRWTLALNIFLFVNYEIGPRLHPSPLVHFLVALVALYLGLCTVLLCQCHLVGSLY